jgi:Kef-type K+ transport system membrane component KefB
VTAFPVLARILSDRRMIGTRMGAIALTCAAVDDVTAWCLLALVVGIAQARTPDAVRTVLLTVAFIAFVFAVVRPVVRRVLAPLEASAQLTRTSLAGILVAMLASAMTTEWIGIHGIFGAFLFGATIPSGTRVARELHDRLDDLIAVLFLPAFFAFTGMRTNVALITGAQNWLICAVILLVACVGKFGGTLVASRFTGLGWRDSAALGVLMNTRGLVELIVLNIGLDLHVISLRLFTMLVLMALITTFMTTPILHVLLRKHPWPQVERMPA